MKKKKIKLVKATASEILKTLNVTEKEKRIGHEALNEAKKKYGTIRSIS